MHKAASAASTGRRTGGDGHDGVDTAAEGDQGAPRSGDVSGWRGGRRIGRRVGPLDDEVAQLDVVAVRELPQPVHVIAGQEDALVRCGDRRPEVDDPGGRRLVVRDAGEEEQHAGRRLGGGVVPPPIGPEPKALREAVATGRIATTDLPATRVDGEAVVPETLGSLVGRWHQDGGRRTRKRSERSDHATASRRPVMRSRSQELGHQGEATTRSSGPVAEEIVIRGGRAGIGDLGRRHPGQAQLLPIGRHQIDHPVPGAVGAGDVADGARAAPWPRSELAEPPRPPGSEPDATVGPMNATTRWVRAPNSAMASRARPTAPAAVPRQPAWTAASTPRLGVDQRDRHAVGDEDDHDGGRLGRDQDVGGGNGLVQATRASPPIRRARRR